MTEKYTNRMFYEDLLKEPAIASNPQYVEKINHLIDVLNNKNTCKSEKPTKNQILTGSIRDAIYAEMQANPDRVYTSTELAKAAEQVVETDIIITSQRARSALAELMEANKVKNIKEGRSSLFQLVA